MSDISRWFLAFFSLCVVILLASLFFLYVRKSKDYRAEFRRLQEMGRIFEKTHNTWHIYKRLSDTMYSGFELDEVRRTIHRDILNVVSNFRDSLMHLHPGHKFAISIKGIHYKNLSALDEADGWSYYQPLLSQR